MLKKLLSLIVLSVFAMVLSTNGQIHFGTGSDGALTVTSGDVVTVDNSRTGVSGDNLAGATSLKVNNGVLFIPGDEVIIITMIDPDTTAGLNRVGVYETNFVVKSSANELVLLNTLQYDFNASGGMKHQVVKIPHFTQVIVNGDLTCSPWDGESGGILFFRSTDTVFVNSAGILHANGKGYRGGTQYGASHGGGQGGESFAGLGGFGGHYTYDPHGKPGGGGGGAAHNGYNAGAGLAGGGGGSTSGNIAPGSANLGGAGGGGGGHAGSGGGAGYGSFGYGGFSYSSANNGLNGGEGFSGNGGSNGTGGGGGGGGTYGDSTLTRLYFGCGGGSGGRHSSYVPGAGGNGGGIVFLTTFQIMINGILSSNGINGANYGSHYSGGGGGGAGGSIFINGHTVSIETGGSIMASGGAGGTGYYGNSGGAGGVG
jgi:hypothetical protein